ncbi:hypothetical protein [Maricaulis maris]|jgi:hypothetical protein|uniref:Uncharacterized protein n=1 Tax=Maricaulis maris (strain MCS10) TaxID=394221 RepID=Q0AP99_MARMM|nr:hypothetical protein [Maricaulis maris]ABI65888.1 hypothetical protein Mmar10_1596 [Maricaulis maris MCS10]
MTDTSELKASSARPSDEMLPFLNNFHDIFTTIGVLILLGGLAVGAGQVMAGLGLDEGEQAFQNALMALIGGIAVFIWFLSALLVGKQRRILPGIVLSSVFGVTTMIVLVWGYAQFLIHGAGISEQSFEVAGDSVDNMEFGREAVMMVLAQLPVSIRFMPVVFGLAFLLPVAAYYFSYRLPYAGGLMGVGVVLTAVMTLLAFDPYTVIVWAPTINVAAGASLLLAGILFDARDPGRETRLAGTAFWLHFFAAPVLLGAVLNVTQTGWTFQESDFANPENLNLFAAMASDSAEATRLAITALIVIGIFALVSLLINRRALIVSGLVTAGVSIGIIVNSAGLGAGAVVAVTLLVLGGVVVVLGAAWNPVRRILLLPIPQVGPLGRIFPPVSAAEG